MKDYLQAVKARMNPPKENDEYEREKERQFKLQMKQIEQLHQMKLAQQAAVMAQAEKESSANKFPSNHELINRIMDMQKRYIERLEIENCRLNETIARLTGKESKDGVNGG